MEMVGTMLEWRQLPLKDFAYNPRKRRNKETKRVVEKKRGKNADKYQEKIQQNG